MDMMLNKGLFIHKLMDLKISNKGFALIEIVLILTLLAVLAIFALPRFFNVSKDVHNITKRGIVCSINAGLELAFARDKKYPEVLDDAKIGVCGANNLCFTKVVFQSIENMDWEKIGEKMYKFQKGKTKTCYLYLSTLEQAENKHGKFVQVECPNN